MPTDAPSDRAPKFIIRLPEGMRDRIAGAAKANGRSMNAEIVQRLEDSFARQAVDAVADVNAMIREIREEMARLAEMAPARRAPPPTPKRRRKP